MAYVAIILLFWAMASIGAFGYLLLWHRRHKTGRSLGDRSMDDNRVCIRTALKRLNCKGRWDKEGSDLIVRYDYQSGHFRIRLESASPYVRLAYLFFFEAEADYLEHVRNVCNLCNLNTETCRLVYSLNKETGMVDVHIVSILLIDAATAADVLERAMKECFRWQYSFADKYKALCAENERSSSRDEEKDEATWYRAQFLIREQEMIHQDEGPDWHASQAAPIRLRQLLASAMALADVVPARLTLTVGTQVSTLDDVDAILDFDISTPLIADGAFVAAAAMARLDFYDPRNPVRLRHLSLDFCQETQTPDTLYYRITLALVPLSAGEAVSPDSSETSRQTASVLLGFDLTPAADRMLEFRYLWKEAMAKQRSGNTGDMSREEQLLCGMQTPRHGYLLFRGRTLYGQQRFYEASLLLENVYWAIQAHVHKLSPQRLAAFYEVCYLVGACHAHLHQYARACYYLQITLPIHNIAYTEEYINCLVNSGDFRAMDYINSFLDDLQPARPEADDEPAARPEAPAVASFRAFLQRRKAYLLVRQGSYDEAEKLLKQLIGDPANSTFALKELAWIQKMRAK